MLIQPAIAEPAGFGRTVKNSSERFDRGVQTLCRPVLIIQVVEPLLAPLTPAPKMRVNAAAVAVVCYRPQEPRARVRNLVRPTPGLPDLWVGA